MKSDYNLAGKQWGKMELSVPLRKYLHSAFPLMQTNSVFQQPTANFPSSNSLTPKY